MDAAIKAFIARWNGDQGAQIRELCTNGVWLTAAPEEVAMPYAVVQYMDGDIEYTNTSKIETVMFAVTIYTESDNGVELILTIGERVKACFDLADLGPMDNTPDGINRRVLRCIRRSTGTLVQDEEGNHSLTYDFEVNVSVG